MEDAKKVGKIGTYTSDIREQFLYEQGFENLASFRNQNANILALINNRIDLWISSNLAFNTIAKKENVNTELFEEVYTIKTTGVYIVFSISTAMDIVRRWTDAFEEMKSDGTLNKIREKWNIPLAKFKIPKK